MSRLALLGVSAFLFVVCTTTTVVWGTSMSATSGTPMPGGWTLSMAWTRMCGQTWLHAAASFLGMWVVMMVTMMLPSLVPVLCRYQAAIGTATGTRLCGLPLIAGAGYFVVWTMIGVVTFAAGAVLAEAELQWAALARAVPVATGVVVLCAGLLQFAPWTMRHLGCYRHTAAPCRGLADDAATAWRHGLRLGLHCSACSAGPTAILLAIGVMDQSAMSGVTVAITVERLAADGRRVAHAIGAVVVAVALFLIARAVVAG